MICRNLVINGRRTSIRMERGFWEALEEVARDRKLTIADLVSEADEVRSGAPLTRTLRVLAVSHFRELLNGATEAVGIG
nr:ribbon-helix-helix domain-containing protein [uncultured Azospirillum sp.]